MPTPRNLAAIEAGGTKFVCALSTPEGDVLAQAAFPTRTPAETFADLADFFRAAQARHGDAVRTGLAAFGPIDLDPASPSFGCLVTTPKAGWSGTNIVRAVASAVGAPVVAETDVNAAALGEGLQGQATGLANFAYVTIGTGIGVGVVLDGQLRQTFPHPEIGHLQVSRAPGDGFAGTCPFHGDCLEGLASGPAMKARWGRAAEELAPDHPGWDMAAHYIAALCVNLAYTLRLDRIVLGGGVMSPPFLVDRVRVGFAGLMAGYALGPRAVATETFIMPTALLETSPALIGAMAMARRAAGDA
ncbi:MULTISPECIES: ROK family protein [unclassified Novosphingobium]|uniref:ROK family protein n=1 Tax=unclassified Novosphingobium TaxID=2644732 RepID=UPI00146C8678|nr:MULTISPECIES: ROK family protein [unclassified Novosphingobium]NMN05039.1 fructokinase [Novosphingobium sp. SG919]NMN87333.1 fructokinase [Novosphingobium sp. SG916]